MKKENYNMIPMLDNACKIIGIISNNGGEAGISYIAKESGLSKSTIFRILYTLGEWKFVRKNEENDKYTLGVFFLKAGEQVKGSLDLRKAARPVMKRISEEVGETINLGIPYEDKVLIMESVSGEASVLVSRLEPIFPLYCSGIGKLLLAQSSQEELENYYDKADINKKTINTIVCCNEMKKVREDILQNGLSIDNEEYEYGLYCVAAPVYDRTGCVIAGISISGPTSRIGHKGFEKMAEKIREAGRQISEILGYEA